MSFPLPTWAHPTTHSEWGAVPDTQVPVLSWSRFLGQFTWKQGEHVSLIGPTGQGKTTLAAAISEQRRYVVWVATKPKDEALDRLMAKGYRRIQHWPPDMTMTRVIFWPTWKDRNDTARQREAIGAMLDETFRAGGWTVVVDELAYLAQVLRLDGRLRPYWWQGRSNHLSLVAATQRPAWVPLEMYSQATHLFLWGDRSGDNLKRLGELNYSHVDTVRRIVSSLARYDVLYVDTRTGEMVITRAPAPPEV